LTPERKAGLDRYLELAGKYFDLKFSEAMFAGAILQVAYIAIRLYSRNASIPANCSALVRPSQKSAIPFCIGRDLHGIPTGLIVYAWSLVPLERASPRGLACFIGFESACSRLASMS
jgi:hypothetical protein